MSSVAVFGLYIGAIFLRNSGSKAPPLVPVDRKGDPTFKADRLLMVGEKENAISGDDKIITTDIVLMMYAIGSSAS